MQHIDKTDKHSKQAFNKIVDNFILQHLQDKRFRYEELTSNERIALRRILRNEQHNMCAYCMKKVPLYQRTTDHVIPKTITREKYGHALNLGKGLYHDIVYEKVYNPYPQSSFYPHSLAYNNMVMACEVCNNTKDQDLIIPIFFDNPSLYISYTDKGRMTITENKVFPEDLKVWLNNENLLTYRCIWKSIKLCGYTIEDVLQADCIQKRKDLLNKIKESIANPQIIKRFNAFTEGFVVDSKWEDFKRFRWFWLYY